MSREQIRAAQRAEAPVQSEESIGIAPHLVAAVDLFASLRSQWRTASAGMGGFVFTGLDYAAVEPAMRLMGNQVKDTQQLFAQLRVMEMAAVSAMNER